MKSAKMPPSPDLIATAERLLSDAFGGIIRLAADDNLTASGCTGVYRLRVLGGPDNVPVPQIIFLGSTLKSA